MKTMPSVFVSHGAPTVLIDGSPSHDFLRRIASYIPKPRAILVISAHWETDGPTLGSAAAPETVHDFHGFPSALYDIRYPAMGAPALAARVADLMVRSGFDVQLDENRGLDHGAWVPLHLGYPDADIPVAQLSVQPNEDPAYHFRLGQSLASLRHDDVLILGSGSFTHNLRAFRGQDVNADAPEWVQQFADWVDQNILASDVDALLDYRARAPFAVDNHPTDEHFLPFFVAMGAAGPLFTSEQLHQSFAYGVLAMNAYAFN